MESTEKQSRRRIGLLDEIRGFAVLLMIIYHCLYLLSEVFNISSGSIMFKFFMPAQPLISGIFIAVSGISSRLSHSNAVRGAKLLGVALAFTFATAVLLPYTGLDGFGIYFGILHFLSVSMLIFALLKPVLNYIPPALGIVLCMIFYILTAGIGDGYLGIAPYFSLAVPAHFYELPWLFPLGIYTKDFTSADYFPIFPKIFLFLAGTYFGIFVKSGKMPEWTYKTSIKPIAWLGKKALLVYIVHVPVLYGLVFFVRWLVEKF